jgi:photosystem II stability/assembly factor-like uncharacterized protein
LIPKPEFQSIQMIDRKNGWAQTARALLVANDWIFPEEQILRTTDGGKSWTSVLSAKPEQCLATCFYDSKTAWVASAGVDGTNIAIFRTRDGGRSWIKSDLSQPSPIMDASLSFPNLRTGWLMLIPEHGMNSEPGALYETKDRGEHWRQVNSTADPRGWYIWEQAAEPEFTNRHPFLVCGGAMTLHDESKGWVWGSLASTSPRFLFVTQDDGRNWQVQPLPFRPGHHGGRMEPIGLPQFFRFSGKEGILPVQFVPANSATASFATLNRFAIEFGERMPQPN